MKILYWANGFWPLIGGMETQALSLLNSLIQQGHQCVVLAQHANSNWPQHEIYNSMPVYRYRFDYAYANNNMQLIAEILFSIRKIITNFKPDVMHLNVGYGAHLATYKMLKKQLNIPSLVTIHDPAKLNNEPVENVYKHIFSLADQAICTSDSMLNELKQYNLYNEVKLTRIYNGLPVPNIEPVELFFYKPKILCWGRLVKSKGFDLVIKALHKLKKRNHELSLMIVGEGPERDNLIQLTCELELTSQVKFYGQVENSVLLDLINAATIVVVPSHLEPFGLVALEAMQLARAVIVSQERGLTEIVKHNVTGLVVEKNSVIAIVEAINYLLENPQLAMQFAQAARMDVLARFSIESMTAQYVQAYKNAIELKEQHAAKI